MKKNYLKKIFTPDTDGHYNHIFPVFVNTRFQVFKIKNLPRLAQVT